MDWDARIVADWQASLTSLQCVWQEHGGFDAILGFSNGAAARCVTALVHVSVCSTLCLLIVLSVQVQVAQLGDLTFCICATLRSFLLAAHVLAHPHDFPGRRLRCVICAGGYLPQPLDALLPTDSEVTRTQEVLSRGDEGELIVCLFCLRECR